MKKTFNAEKQRQEAITREMLAGDAQAYEQFFKDTQQKGVYHAFKMLQNWHDAEDVVQQVYMELIELIQDKKTTIFNIYACFWKTLHWRYIRISWKKPTVNYRTGPLAVWTPATTATN